MNARLRGIVELESVHRGVPPANCSMGCPEHLGPICATCVQRPVKEHEIVRVPVTYGQDAGGNAVDIRDEKGNEITLDNRRE